MAQDQVTEQSFCKADTLVFNINTGNTTRHNLNAFKFEIRSKCYNKIRINSHLDCYLFTIGNVNSQVDVAKTSTSNFTNQTIFASNDKLRPRSRRYTGHFDFLRGFREINVYVENLTKRFLQNERVGRLTKAHFC